MWIVGHKREFRLSLVWVTPQRIRQEMWICLKVAWVLYQPTCHVQYGFFPYLSNHSDILVMKPTRTGSQLQLLSGARVGVGAIPHASAAAGSTEWHHLPLSQAASTRSSLEQPSLDRKHTNNLPLSALRNELTTPGSPALSVCQVMSGLVSWHFGHSAGVSFMGHHPACTRW